MITNWHSFFSFNSTLTLIAKGEWFDFYIGVKRNTKCSCLISIGHLLCIFCNNCPCLVRGSENHHITTCSQLKAELLGFHFGDKIH